MSNVIQLRPSAPIRRIDASPARAHAEALMRHLFKDPDIPFEHLTLLSDFLEPMLAKLESANG